MNISYIKLSTLGQKHNCLLQLYDNCYGHRVEHSISNNMSIVAVVIPCVFVVKTIFRFVYTNIVYFFVICLKQTSRVIYAFHRNDLVYICAKRCDMPRRVKGYLSIS